MSAFETVESRNAERRYVKTAMKAPMLSAEHEIELARRWRDDADEAALHELTSAYMRLVISMAGRFRNYGLPVADLIQEGNVGLMQAAARFDPAREVRFSTYASWWIRAAIQDFVLRNWSIVRTGTTSAQKSLFFKLRRLRAQINDFGDARMSREARAHVAAELRVDEREVEMMASRLSASDRSLNAPMANDGDGEAEWQDYVADDAPLPEDVAMASHDGAVRARVIGDAMARLNEREHMIITERRLGDDVVTLETLGARLGISKERVRQIEQQALKKLRSFLVDNYGDPGSSGLLPAN